MKAGVGMVPWNAAATYLTGDRGFCVQNVFLNAGKSWDIEGTDSMSVGVFTNLIWNPALDDVNFVGASPSGCNRWRGRTAFSGFWN